MNATNCCLQVKDTRADVPEALAAYGSELLHRSRNNLTRDEGGRFLAANGDLPIESKQEL